MTVKIIQKLTEDGLKKTLKEKKSIYLVKKNKGKIWISIVGRVKGVILCAKKVNYCVLVGVDIDTITSNVGVIESGGYGDIFENTEMVHSSKMSINSAVDNILHFFSKAIYYDSEVKDIIPYILEKPDGQYAFIVR